MALRRQLLDRLLVVLSPQISSEVELIIRESDAAMPVGENREAMRLAAYGDYVSFVDDDDLVHPQFVSRILPLLDGVDYVGFNVEQRINGSLRCIEQRSLRFTGVSQDDRGGHYRDISHLNPMRRELALRVAMSGFPEEDTRWANGMRQLGIVKTEHYVNKVLYYYLFRVEKPEYEGHPAIPTTMEYPWLMKRTKVKMCVSISGGADPRDPAIDLSFGPGQVVEIHPGLAESWILSGLAVRIDEPEEIEAAVMPDVETAVIPSAVVKGRTRMNKAMSNG